MKPGWREWLALKLEKGPTAHGWVEDQRWTPARISTVIARRSHVRFSPAQTWRVLHRMVDGADPGPPGRRTRRRHRDRLDQGDLATGGKALRGQDAWRGHRPLPPWTRSPSGTSYARSPPREQFRFRHPLVRAAVCQEAGADWRIEAHTRAADGLALQGAPLTAQPCGCCGSLIRE
ncbi:winged helix-turn-helix domain-containing protein [Streptomyces sp. NPDC048523]|uniref:winged helix-turn-helix domain-containing protein n=1 Tax=Streptomyces sp. NPDC048523 TaxID=3365567 RepID=UPI0037241270